ncbi:hypothetical protein [Photorhabdus aegyptia]|uniref:hypothetical protein n=1 Tax=Photorhabdus aegyptia TaxID=2805098 RepID=UPI003B8A754A
MVASVDKSCLYDNAPFNCRFRLFIEFLSYLYGSERTSLNNLVLLSFLSCLYGSELVPAENWITNTFLSCLYGSEQVKRNFASRIHFLSCLYGSELLHINFNLLTIKAYFNKTTKKPFFTRETIFH